MSLEPTPPKNLSCGVCPSRREEEREERRGEERRGEERREGEV